MICLSGIAGGTMAASAASSSDASAAAPHSHSSRATLCGASAASAGSWITYEHSPTALCIKVTTLRAQAVVLCLSS